MRSIRPYGSWESPVKPADLAGACLGLQDAKIDAGNVWWLESRPAESGRNVICSSHGDAVPSDVNVRSRVHEYGGGAWAVSNNVLYFSHDRNRSLYHCPAGGRPEILVASSGARYADLEPDPVRSRLYCIRENGDENIVASVDLVCGTENTLIGGADFYSSPRLSPDGRRLAWIEWSHPDMPWDSTTLYCAALDDAGNLSAPVRVAGGPGESVVQPKWSPNGILYFVSDRTGWWNIYRQTPAGAESVTPMNAECAHPHWQFGMSSYAFASGKLLVCAFTQDGFWSLGRVNVETLEMRRYDLPFTYYHHLDAKNGQVAFIAGSAREPDALISMDAETADLKVVKKSTEIRIAAESISEPQSIVFPSSGGRKAYGLFYPPCNSGYQAPENEKPPLVVMVHGGPTSAAKSSLSLRIQFWTTRGIAVLDVNYAGSTGYGRAFRESLNGQWGVADVDDCCNGANYLADRGLVDGGRMAITGGSAGGFTALAALTFRNVFSAGVSRYGVSDCSALARDTHKFEAHYLDRLIAPYPGRKDVYDERSPLLHADQLNRPVIFFQGLEDRVVPPEQSREMFEALASRMIPTAYVAYEGEQHGFRKRENILRTIEAELFFLSRIFNFRPADALQPVEIRNELRNIP
ncbi:MAG: prolyl oligopeptidase family serine peptidase [Kiritimatiellia bacterium]